MIIITFKEWCVENNNQDLLDRWDYELNNCNPNEITYGTGKSFWFKCPKGIHESELKNINKITTHEISIKCFKCTRIAITHPEYKEYFVNLEDIYKYSYGDHRKVLMQCPICGYQKNKSIADLIKSGFGCQKCGNSISYPERFMASFLNELNILYKKELSKHDFDWCDRFKYDFYIPHVSCIIETHGEQHYKPMRLANKKRTLEEEQNNDIQKKQLALNNNISFYIVLNCEKSEPTWIKNSILNSGLLDILKLQENNINWNDIYISALTNITKQVCDLYSNGVKQKDISKQLKIHTSTVKTLLKKGSQVGLCDYKPKTKKSVICINTGQLFESLRKAGEEYQISHSNISECCNGLKDNINGYRFEFL